jgi:hypothetical protein
MSAEVVVFAGIITVPKAMIPIVLGLAALKTT